MEYIDVVVQDKRASTVDPRAVAVCGNTDYVIQFSFDEEWEEYNVKTARFVTANGYVEQVFDGNLCSMPLMQNVNWVEIGVYAGLLHTTTRAYLRLDRSILCGSDEPRPDPPEDVYNQLMERYNLIPVPTTENNGQVLGVSGGKYALVKQNGGGEGFVGDAVTSVNGIGPDENGNVELTLGATDYNTLTNRPITRIESLDTTKLVNFRDLESGQYLLYGYFSPYENSDISLTADNSLVSVIRKNAGSHLICLDPLNAKVVFFEILVDETAEKGYQYTRTIIPLLDVNALIEKVGNLDELETQDKTSLVAAINEALRSGGSGGSSGSGMLEIDNHTLVNRDGVLAVNTADVLEQDNTLPITSAAVHATVGNIEVLLSTI